VPDSENHIPEVKRVTMAHGAGGRMSRDLIRSHILRHFRHPTLSRLEDSALFPVDGGRLAFTTDSYVIQPLFFPGGDIGKLAVSGTVNDLLCVGARPLYLSLGLIVEEGFSLDDLDRILASASKEALGVGVEVLCGDTKVVERGKGDGLFVNTSGIGVVPAGVEITPENVQVGDAIVVTGPIGDHGIAVLSQREGFGFASQLKSDCASLLSLVQSVLDPSLQVRCLRDPTRGGLGTILAEIALDRQVGIRVEEEKIPIRDEVRGASELLGLDPLYVANEGKMVLFVAQKRTGDVLSILKKDSMGKQSALIGQVVDDHPGLAVLRTKQKQYEDAEHLFREALEGRKLKLGDDHPDTLETKNDLAVLYKEQGKYDEAETLLLESIEGRRLKLGDTHPHTLESLNNLIDLYEAWDKPEKAEEWRAKLSKTEAVTE